MRGTYEEALSVVKTLVESGWSTATHGLLVVERLAGSIVGAGVGSTQAVILLFMPLLDKVPGARRILESTHLLESGEGGRDGGKGRMSHPEEDVQVVGLGGGYTLNFASVEAEPEAPSPQYTPRGEAREDGVQFIEKKEAGIGAAGPRGPTAPATPGQSLRDRPGMNYSPRVYGERYTGQEVEALGSEMQGAEEPGRGQDGMDAVGPTSPRRARLDNLFKETQELRARTTASLQAAEALPGGGRFDQVEEAPLPISSGGRTGMPPASMVQEPMPGDITGEEGRPSPPTLEALPEEGGSLEGSAHAGDKRAASVPLERATIGAGAEPVPRKVEVLEGEQPGSDAAEARLKGLFAPVGPSDTTGVGAAPQITQTLTKGRPEPGSEELIGGWQGERVHVERMVFVAGGLGAAAVAGPVAAGIAEAERPGAPELQPEEAAPAELAPAGAEAAPAGEAEATPPPPFDAAPAPLVPPLGATGLPTGAEEEGFAVQRRAAEAEELPMPGESETAPAGEAELAAGELAPGGEPVEYRPAEAAEEKPKPTNGDAAAVSEAAKGEAAPEIVSAEGIAALYAEPGVEKFSPQLEQEAAAPPTPASAFEPTANAPSAEAGATTPVPEQAKVAAPPLPPTTPTPGPSAGVKPMGKKKSKGPWHKFKKEMKKVFSPP